MTPDARLWKTARVGWICGLMFLSRRNNNTSYQVVGATLYQYNTKARSSSVMLVLPPRQRCMKLTGGLLAFKRGLR